MTKRIKPSMLHIYKLDTSLFKTVEKLVCIHESSSSWIFFLQPFKSELIKEVFETSGEREKFYKYKKYSVSTNKYPSFWFFWKDHWFNVLLTLKPENKSTIYLKLACPPIFEENAFKYVDFDLSLRIRNNQELTFLNSDEYIANCAKLKYSKNLQKELSKTMRAVLKLLKSNWFEKLTKEEFISSLWTQVTTLLGKPKEELLVKKIDKFTVERLEVDEFE